MRTVNSLRWSLATGAPPIVPSAAGVFCAWMASETSAGVRLNSGEFGRVEPDAQRIVERTEQRGLADAVDARQRVEHVDRRVIAEKQLIVGAFRRIERQHLQQRRRFLADRQALQLTPPAAIAAGRASRGSATLTVSMSGLVPSAKVTLSV